LGLKGTTGSAVYSVGPGGLPHTRARAHARTHARTNTHALARILARTHFQPHTRARRSSLTHMHTPSDTCTHTRAHVIQNHAYPVGTQGHALTHSNTHTRRAQTHTHACMQSGPITVSLFLALSCDMSCVHIWLHAHRSRTYTSVHVYTSAHRNAHTRTHARVCMLIRGDTSLPLLLARAHTRSLTHLHAHTHIYAVSILTHTRARAHTYNARGIV
jgi:hypothetical protein